MLIKSGIQTLQRALLSGLILMTGCNSQEVSHKATKQALSPDMLKNYDSKQWQLIHWPDGTTVDDTVFISLQIQSLKISGSSGCNRYFAQLNPLGDEVSFNVSKIGTTRRACPKLQMAAENRYLDHLAQASLAYLHEGNLILVDKAKDPEHRLVYTSK